MIKLFDTMRSPQPILTKIIAFFTSHNWIERMYILLPLIYIIAISAYLLYHRAWFSPDQFFAVALLATILLRRSKQFVKDWLPLLLLIFGYEYLRGVIPIVSKSAHTLPMIWADNFLFGYIPTIKFQAVFFTEGHFKWYDYLSVFLYTAHFVIPMILAFVFWLHDRSHFRLYAAAFLILSYAAFFTYVVFPSAPPWMASNQGYLPPLHKIMDQVYASFAHPISIPSIYQFIGANPVAAFPSMHAAYPWLGFLFVRKKSRFFGLLTLLYVLGVWFSVIYLGEHYFVDVLAGAFYSTVAYLLVIWYTKMKRNQIYSALSIPANRNYMGAN